MNLSTNLQGNLGATICSFNNLLGATICPFNNLLGKYVRSPGSYYSRDGSEGRDKIMRVSTYILVSTVWHPPTIRGAGAARSNRPRIVDDIEGKRKETKRLRLRGFARRREWVVDYCRPDRSKREQRIGKGRCCLTVWRTCGLALLCKKGIVWRNTAKDIIRMSEEQRWSKTFCEEVSKIDTCGDAF